jgi:hypothetical protein
MFEIRALNPRDNLAEQLDIRSATATDSSKKVSLFGRGCASASGQFTPGLRFLSGNILRWE